MTENRRNPRKSVSERKNQLDKTSFGRLSSVLGILVAVPGVFFVGQVTTLAFLGILLAVLGFALGARRLGTAAIVVSVLVLLFGLAAFSELIPGVDAPGYSDQTPEGYE
jgi:hypothetical protein